MCMGIMSCLILVVLTFVEVTKYLNYTSHIYIHDNARI